MINHRLLFKKYKHKYNGLNPIEYAKSKQVQPLQIIQFLEKKMIEFADDAYDEEQDDEKNDEKNDEKKS